jgi:hypothetical protein
MKEYALLESDKRTKGSLLFGGEVNYNETPLESAPTSKQKPLSMIEVPCQVAQLLRRSRAILNHDVHS